jgi:hypothetical protein
MNRAIPIILSVALIILVGCGDEEQGFPNPLQIEVLTGEEKESSKEEESSPGGSVTGRVLFTDDDSQIRAYALSSNEYVIFEGLSKKVSGKDLVVFVDFPSNNATYLMEDGYFQITDVEPGSHELILMHTADVVIVEDTGILPGGNYTEIDVPTCQWTVTVESGKNTTMGSLAVPISDLEWKQGETGQEVVVPQEPEPPVVPTKPPAKPPVRPSAKPLVNPAEVEDGHIWLLDDVSGNQVPDDSANDNVGTIAGDPQVVPGLSGMALQFDGVDDAVHIPDSAKINITNGPWQNRTIMAVFNCSDVSKKQKQTIYEEGGTTRGLNIYVFDGQVYAGGWNRAEYNWDGAWISTPIRSDSWYEVALILRDAGDAVEDGKFEMWLNGQLIASEPAGQIYNHSADIGIGDTNGDTYFHDGSRSGSGDFFEGIVDEVWVLNQALTEDDLSRPRVSVESVDKLTATWGMVKAQH